MTATNKSDLEEQTFKILSVDGGGFKGLYAATLLNELEKAHGLIAQHFDMLCGTSTGALIVLPLAAGKSAADIATFYKEQGPKIFPSPGKIGSIGQLIRQVWHKSKYSNAALKAAANQILGETRMVDANSYLCIPAFDFIRSRPRVFKTNHDSSLNRDNMLMSEVAVASAAAPMFFPIATCQEDQGPAYYIDGGIWANNPALVGLIEACRYFVGPGKPYQRVRILSIANVSPACGRLASAKYPASPMAFAGQLLEAAGEGQQASISHAINFLGPSMQFGVDYVRIEAPDLSVEQSRGVKLDIANQQAIETLSHYGANSGHEHKNRDDVKQFFVQAASPPVITRS